MKKLKHIIALILACVLMLALCACGEKTGNEEPLPDQGTQISDQNSTTEQNTAPPAQESSTQENNTAPDPKETDFISSAASELSGTNTAAMLDYAKRLEEMGNPEAAAEIYAKLQDAAQADMKRLSEDNRDDVRRLMLDALSGEDIYKALKQKGGNE